jgi:nucleotide-binding universal stress UspA family protein
VHRTILVPLDGSRFGEHALPWALALAGRLDAGLELATVAGLAPPLAGASGAERLPGDDGRERGMALAERYLQEVVERIRSTGFDGELGWTVIPPGNVAAALVRHLAQVTAELTIMTTHGRGPLQRAWLGSSADSFIRRSPRPVLLVRPEPAEDEGQPLPLEHLPELPRRVLLPLDGSPQAERLVELAPPMADPKALFILLRVIPPFLPGGSPYLPHVVREAEDQERVREAASGYLEEIADGLRGAGRDAEVRVPTAGQPGHAILELAKEEDVDLIAMSTSGRGGVARLLLGSVADKVIRGSPCPVLLHREQE